ncbi:TonB-dependent receptor [Asticcacaulis sp. DXS10W]|uniref:TonB-dependent receptor n=1 Tax=Asticcacaulis currens TaxID=2984210 RepID=A0ABT5ICI3_9CAUL|nr:TonB-dependent receptor [Asticcacaulis currens]MDC7693702.1 TonB-dependent receptor [Asticcacaulis currens]
MLRPVSRAFCLSTASLAALSVALLGGEAVAQTASNTSAAPQQDIETIVVSGVRASLKRAQDVKRDAVNVIEAVTPNDLGQFDDNSVADVLQRVPGVQIERDDAATDGDRISIRGLGPNFVQTSFMGRTPMSSGSEGQRNIRSFNFDTVPQELINGLIVAKTPTADFIEQGLAGSVDINILKPLDARFAKKKNMFASVEARATYSDLAKTTKPRLSFVVGGRNKDKTFGWYLSGLHSEQDAPTYQVQNRDGYTPGGTANRATFRVDTNGDGIYNNGDTFYTNGVSSCTTAPAIAGVAVVTTGPNANNAVACDNTQFDIFNGILSSTLLTKQQTRDAVGLALQWRPKQGVDITFDYQHSENDNQNQRYTLNTSLNSGSGTGGAVPINNATAFFAPNSIIIDTTGGPTANPYIRGWNGAGLIGYLGSEGSGTSDLATATNTNFRDVLQVTTSTGNFSNKTVTDMAGLNFKFTGDKWSNTTDISASRNKYNQSFTVIELRQRYRNAFRLGDIGFNIIDGYPVVTNLDKLNIAAVPVTTDVFNSASCATRICVEYNQTGSLGLGATAADQYRNAYNGLFSLGSQVRRRETQFDGTNYGIRTDFKYDFDDGFFQSVIFGLRFSESEIDSVTSVVRRYAGNMRSTALGANCTATDGIACISAAQSAFVKAITQNASGGVDTVTLAPGTPAQINILKINADGACAANPGFCTDTLANGGLIARPNSSFTYKERIVAPYVGLNFKSRFMGAPFRGSIGVRLASTRWESTAGQVANYNIVIPTTGGGPTVAQCKNSAQLSLVAGACPTISIVTGSTRVNTNTGVMAANGSFPATATAPLTRGLTSEGDTYLDEIYFATVPGSLRNPNTISVEGNYVDALPSFNLNFSLTENMRLRLGIGYVVSRPDPFQISPVASVSLTDNDAYEQSIASSIVAAMAGGVPYEQAVQSTAVKTALATSTANIITAGNPEIKPFRAKNYDLTFEYYTPNDGSIVVSAFYKDVKDFIIQALMDDVVFVDGYNFDSTIDANTTALTGKPIPFRVRKYINYSDAEVYGYEFNVNQPFTFLPRPFDGMGINFNYTYVDSKFDKDVGNYGFGFPGSSKDNVNAVLYYGDKLFDVRLAYNYRSAYIRALAGTGSQSNLTRFTAPQKKLDLSITYKPTPNLQVRLNATNLTDQDRYDYSFSESAVMDRFASEKVYTLSLRYRY